jgi:hypothetical protein
MVLVNRDSVRMLADDWKVLGVYFLLGPLPSDPDRFRAYVGEVGRRNLLTRLLEHAAQKDWWSRALLVTSASAEGFTSAEIGWLEGRFYDVLNNAVAADVMNKSRPGDDSIPLKDRGVLERYVDPVMAALRACGAPPDTADQQPPPKGKKRAYFREGVKDLLEAGLLKPGTRLTPMRKHLTTTALVLADGSLEVEGTGYQALSSAAVAVSGSKSEPGWEFWGAPSGDGGFVPLYTLRDRLRAGDLPIEPSAAAVPVAGEALHSAAVQPPRVRRIEGSVRDLIDAGLIAAGEELVTTRRGKDFRARVLPSGAVETGGVVYQSLSTAAKAASGNLAEPGWEFWGVIRNGSLVRLFELRGHLPRRSERGLTPQSEGGH